MPDLSIENKKRQLNFNTIAGVDEAGRGPWAGPVYSAIVILNKDRIPQGINDSKKISEKNIVEVIFALSATIEADTTSFYIFKTLKNLDVKVSVLARGIPVGDQLEYTDEVTLARSIQNRRPYESNLSNH